MYKFVTKVPRVIVLTLLVLPGFSVVTADFVLAQTFAKSTSLNKNYLISNVLKSPHVFTKSQIKVLKPADTQAAADKTEDGPPSGPSNQIAKTELTVLFSEASPRYIDKDFASHIPFSDEIYRDHTSLNTFYFLPSGYLLKRDPIDGFEIDFLHLTRDEEANQDSILMAFTLETRQLKGGLSLMKKLASYAIEPPANDKPVSLNRLPISDVKVNFAGLSSLIPEENIKVLNHPSKVGDQIKVQARMNQGQKESIVASIRSNNLSGEVVFKINGGDFEINIPYVVSFTDYSGDWLTDITQLTTSESIENVSPFPLIVSGIVAYTADKSKKTINRYEIPMVEPIIMEPGAHARADKSYAQLISSYGDVVTAWPTFERVVCDECLNVIEREILVSPAQARRTDLPIEAIPSVFTRFEVFKLLVEVRSNLFSPNNDYTEVKVFTLRPDQSITTATLFVNRDDGEQNQGFEYRVKAVLESGEPAGFSVWKSNNGVMDITVTAGDIRPQLPSTDEGQ